MATRSGRARRPVRPMQDPRGRAAPLADTVQPGPEEVCGRFRLACQTRLKDDTSLRPMHPCRSPLPRPQARPGDPGQGLDATLSRPLIRLIGRGVAFIHMAARRTSGSGSCTGPG